MGSEKVESTGGFSYWWNSEAGKELWRHLKCAVTKWSQNALGYLFFPIWKLFLRLKKMWAVVIWQMVSHRHSSLKWAFHSYILWRLEASSNTAARPAIEDFHPHLQPARGHCGQNISRTSRSAPGLIDQQIPGASVKRDLPARVWLEPGPIVGSDLDTEPKGVVLKVSWKNRSHGLRSAWSRKEEGGGEVEVLLHKTLGRAQLWKED